MTVPAARLTQSHQSPTFATVRPRIPSEMNSKVLWGLDELFNKNGNLQLNQRIIVWKRSWTEVFLHESPVLPEFIAVRKHSERGCPSHPGKFICVKRDLCF